MKKPPSFVVLEIGHFQIELSFSKNNCYCTITRKILFLRNTFNKKILSSFLEFLINLKGTGSECFKNITPQALV